ncbi:MAG: hypothetical protein BroJett029_22170 [Alphaproteobacteria bacterium]|nr:MAG: hypothetical protein BroJett029_22170 [Alphaproteobacteria bacterium]
MGFENNIRDTASHCGAAMWLRGLVLLVIALAVFAVATIAAERRSPELPIWLGLVRQLSGGIAVVATIFLTVKGSGLLAAFVLTGFARLSDLGAAVAGLAGIFLGVLLALLTLQIVANAARRFAGFPQQPVTLPAPFRSKGRRRCMD